tara:strand:- start:225 stop:626 length:402 start_codon:yes stop_codon:yes gene_type:complete
MEHIFNLEIISPEKIIYSGKAEMVTLPSFEGDMSILKNHISLITFLRPGIVKVKKNDNDENDEFFVQDGTVEFNNDNLTVLSETAINVKNISKDFLENLNKKTNDKLSDIKISDQERYMLNYKVDTIKNIKVN